MKKFVASISLSQLIIEFLSVIFAVLFALGINSYRETRNHKKEAHNLKLAILHEFKTNQIKIDSMLHNNQLYFDYLDSLVKMDRNAVKSVQLNYKLDLLTSAAWQLAQNNASSNLIDQEFLLSAAELYQTQDFFINYASGFFQNVGADLKRQHETSDYDTALSLYFHMNVLMSFSHSLSKGYADFLIKYAEQAR